jgi:hypothetical protein
MSKRGRGQTPAQKKPSLSEGELRQVNAFPVRLVQVDPANLGTADAAFFGQGDNGLDYCVKTVAKTPAVPAAELLCHLLAEECGLAVPQFDLVELPDGTIAFGSVWDGTALSRQETVRVLIGQLAGRQIARNLSRIYAFDLFVHNTDRHMGNYLCVAGRNPGHALKCYDFSRALTSHGWPIPRLPMRYTDNTVRVGRQLRKIHPVDFGEIATVLDRLLAVTSATFERFVEGVPQPWLDMTTRQSILKWWESGRERRVEQIREGVKDGSLL